MRTCSETGCARKHYGLGYCHKHYSRMRRNGRLDTTNATRGAPQDFVMQAAASETDDCIIWPYSMKPNGYGQLLFEGKSSRSHRVVLEIAKGPPPSEHHYAAHDPVTCHNRACCNPRHLRWATPAENCSDKYLDGTMPLGDRAQHSGNPISREAVLNIRADKRTHKEIAVTYGVAIGTVGKIKRRERWAWL